MVRRLDHELVVRDGSTARIDRGREREGQADFMSGRKPVIGTADVI